MLPHAKNNPSGNIGAPLWVWIKAFVFALIFLVISFLGFSRTDFIDQFNANRLERFAIPGEEKLINIAVIGTSLVGCAFPKDESMERLAQDRGKKIRFLTFRMDSGILNEYYDITEAVIKSSADIIFIEAALFGLDLNPVGIRKRKLGDHRAYLRAGLKTLLLDPLFGWEKLREQIKYKRAGLKTLLLDPLFGLEQLRKKIKYIFTDTPLKVSSELQSEKELERYKVRASGFRIRNFREGENFAALFDMARQRGKLVVFLDLSRSQKAWEMLPPTFEGELAETMGRYTEVYGIPYLRFPYRLTLDYFLDFSHFGPKGRKFYSEWFLSSLSSISGDAKK